MSLLKRPIFFIVVKLTLFGYMKTSLTWKVMPLRPQLMQWSFNLFCIWHCHFTSRHMNAATKHNCCLSMKLHIFFTDTGDPMTSRVDPRPVESKSGRQMNNQNGYILTPDRLRLIRSELLYPFYDKGKAQSQKLRLIIASIHGDTNDGTRN